MGDVINFENVQNVHQSGVVWVTSSQEATSGTSGSGCCTGHLFGTSSG